jgi:hypothetical protein
VHRINSIIDAGCYLLYIIVGGSDYQEIRKSLYFDDYYYIYYYHRQSFSVAIIDDLLLEGTENFTLRLSGYHPYSPYPYSIILDLSPDVSIVTIIDDDVPGILLL